MVIGKSLLPNKKAFFFVLIQAILTWAVASSYLTANKPFISSPRNTPLLQIDSQLLYDGDIIFREGHDLVSRLVLSQGNSAKFSHVGIILKQGENVTVIHSLPKDASSADGVQIESIHSFSSPDKAANIAVYRIINLKKESRQKIKEFALQQVGKPFDSSFLMSSNDRMYCTELVIKALAATDIVLTNELAPINIMLIDELVFPPDHLRHSQDLSQIKLKP